MPPFLPRKRSTPPVSPRIAPAKRARLTDALDAEATNNPRLLNRTKTFSVASDTSSESSLSDIDSDQFEDVSIKPKQQKITLKSDEAEDDDDDIGDEDDDVEWEDAAPDRSAEVSSSYTTRPHSAIQINLRRDDEGIIDYGTSTKAGSGKKGPSRREKHVRIITHKLHVQFLLWHNAIRNNWIADKEVQNILVKQLPVQIANEVTKWRRCSGLELPETSNDISAKGRRKRKRKEESDRNQRDWGKSSSRLEPGKADMIHGDPILSLLKVLSAYWKKRFTVTAPGLRKRGYGTKHGLKQEITSFRLDDHDAERHGEKIQSLAEFRKIAEKAEGSRDIGAQLFTALLRGLGIEARLIASLQPSGYGWTKAEQMLPKKSTKPAVARDLKDQSRNQTKSASALTPHRSVESMSFGPRKSRAISLLTDTEDEDSDDELGGNEAEDDDSVIDVTPSERQRRRSKYDRDLVCPIYWTEVVSPITHKVTPVSPLVLETSVVNSPETLSLFEPKGVKAENGKQVMAYVVAYSPDGTAKDVTVRYLRKHIWPGKTKGFRIPVEKVPVYDERGKVKRHEHYDWFKFTLSPYTRSDTKRTAVDDVEDTADLTPRQPDKKNDEGEIDTLQSLKSSADFVLERFLRREEALLPNAVAVRNFVSGKGDKYKEEPVYRRADVERCLTAESWHKEGRRPKLGETPLKMVPVRAVTLTRKREAEEHQRQYGEKQMQGLYSLDQTEWIIPPPIKDGIIPKNAYGNMDCFVPSMVPVGAVHIPLRGTVRICKKLDIDFAEAVTGFEFGNKRAVPVCTGVVVAKEHEQIVRDAWAEWHAEQKRKEETKMEKLVLDLWRKFVLGLRIRERVQDMYGEEIDGGDEMPTGVTQHDAIIVDDADDDVSNHTQGQDDDEETIGGGFLLPHEEEAVRAETLIMDEGQMQSQEHLSKRTDTRQSPSRYISMSQHSKHGKCGSHTLSTSSEPSVFSSDAEDEAQEVNGNQTVGTSRTSRLTQLPQSSQKTSRLNTNGAGRLTEPKGEAKSSSSEDDDAADSSAFGIQETEGEDDDDNIDHGEEEIYTPRATRTRAARPQLNVKADPSEELSSSAKAHTKPSLSSRATSRTTPRLMEKSPKVRGIVASGKAAATPLRGRGGPRKSTSGRKETATSMQSTKSKKKQTKSVTSPYFEQ